MKETQFLRVSVNELIPYAKNARTHTNEQIDKVAKSIEEFGFLNPVIISEGNEIIAGHCRVLAAKKLGLEEVPCIKEDFLTEAQKRAYILADNKLALDAGWDEELLASELAELDELGFDLELSGFALDELEELLAVPADDQPTGQSQDSQDIQVVRNTSEELDLNNYSADKFHHTCPRCGFTFNDKRGDGM